MPRGSSEDRLTNAFGCLFVLAWIAGIAFWAVVIFVAIHFIAKWW